jgi:hypothetical protein
MMLRCLLLALLSLLSIPAQADNNLLGPPDGPGATTVDIGFFLSNITDISEEDETFDFEGLLSMKWTDTRLAFDPQETGYDQLYFQGAFQFNEVFTGWWPQIYLANEAGRFDQEASVLKISPSGDVHLTQEIDAVAKSRMNLRRFPFDQQKFVALFEVLGMDKRRVVLRADPSASGIWQEENHAVSIPQWYEPNLSTRVHEYDPIFSDGHDDPLTAFRVEIDIKRNPWYMLRLVFLPVMFFVFLSWSVFWMDRSSVGDRMDISFIGILTVVAYQIMFSESLPKISYLTVLMSFMIISFLMMCASVVINLRVASHDKHGHTALGDRVDKLCRYIFPVIYLLSTVTVGLYVYLVD